MGELQTASHMDIQYIFVALLIISLVYWAYIQIIILIDTINYQLKLNRLRPNAEVINIDKYSSALEHSKNTYNDLLKMIQCQFHICSVSRQESSLAEYVTQEAIYRRGNRKESSKPRYRKHWKRSRRP